VIDKEAIKELIDKECYEMWHKKRCSFYNNHEGTFKTPCWICPQNRPLAIRIYDAIKEAMNG
jgi:hypothetical protein